MALPATGTVTRDGSCCCGDCYGSAVESLCLTLDVECAGWAGEQVTITKTGGATLTHCGTECVQYVGTIGNPCGSLNTVLAYLPCPVTGPPSASYVFVFVYNTGLTFPDGPCRAFSTDQTLACTFTSEGYTPPTYPIRWDDLGGDTGADCIDICDCGLADAALAGSVTFSDAPCGEALAAGAAAKAATAPAPPCRFEGDELTGAERAVWGLDHRRRWLRCGKAGFERVGLPVTDCRSCGTRAARRCGAGRCPGYEPADVDGRPEV